MLFNCEYLDKFDSSEDCVVAKLLFGLIFNPFVPANCQDNYRLAREFLRYYLDDRVDNLNLANAEVLLKPKFSWFNPGMKQAKDRTAPDLLLLIPNDCIIAFEAKYTLPIQAANPSHLPHQLLREYDHLQSLDTFQVKERFLFLLMTQQRLWSHVRRGSYDTGLQILRQCVNHCGANFRVNTWNCVYQVLSDIRDTYLPGKDKLLSFIGRKSNYMTNSLDGRRSNRVALVGGVDEGRSICTWSQLRDMIIEGQDHLESEKEAKKPSHETTCYQDVEIVSGCDTARVNTLIQELIERNERFVTRLGRNLKQDIERGQYRALSFKVYAQLSRWCWPDRDSTRERWVRPRAHELSRLLFGRVVERVR